MGVPVGGLGAGMVLAEEDPGMQSKALARRPLGRALPWYTVLMPRFFNTTGPCDPARHYMLPPEKRLVRAQLSRYIENELYWVLHAARQTGKTTFLMSWMKTINSGSQALACYVSVERCQEFTTAAEAMPAICSAIRSYAESYLGPGFIPPMPETEPASMLDRIMKDWAALVAPKPLVVFDRTPAGRALTWSKRLYRETCQADGGPVMVFGG